MRRLIVLALIISATIATAQTHTSQFGGPVTSGGNRITQWLTTDNSKDRVVTLQITPVSGGNTVTTTQWMSNGITTGVVVDVNTTAAANGLSYITVGSNPQLPDDGMVTSAGAGGVSSYADYYFDEYSYNYIGGSYCTIYGFPPRYCFE